MAKKDPSKALKIKNNLLLSLASWLNEQSLAGRESRERSRFVTVVSEHLQTVEKERQEILEKFTKKDKDGKPKKITVDKVEQWDIDEKDIKVLEKEITELLDEDFALDIGEGHKAKIKTVKDIVLNTDYKFGPKEDSSMVEQQAKIRQMNDYDKWCEVFEDLVI